MWPNPQEIAVWPHLLKKSLIENFIFCAVRMNRQWFPILLRLLYFFSMEYRIYKVATLADHCFDKDLPISESMVLRSFNPSRVHFFRTIVSVQRGWGCNLFYYGNRTEELGINPPPLVSQLLESMNLKSISGIPLVEW